MLILDTNSDSVESDRSILNDRRGKMELTLGARFIFFSVMKCSCFSHDGEIIGCPSLLKEENAGYVLPLSVCRKRSPDKTCWLFQALFFFSRFVCLFFGWLVTCFLKIIGGTSFFFNFRDLSLVCK